MPPSPGTGPAAGTAVQDQLQHPVLLPVPLPQPTVVRSSCLLQHPELCLCRVARNKASAPSLLALGCWDLTSAGYSLAQLRPLVPLD